MDDVIQQAKFIRLQNGDDIISEVMEVEDETGVAYTLFRPLKVVYIPSDAIGYLTVAFMPWVFPRICDQQEFVVHSQDILMICDITDKMNEYYWENLDHFSKKTAKEEERTEERLKEETFDKIKEAFEQAGIDTKKVYH